ncbi:MAG: outer membrane beta-barrel protein, partial [Verrucomicrobia bacterium]|nr:outer membrane beta-barrel protein [Verrucomicrobiota bacterium]
RSEMELYWQPEFRYRFDADPEAITYQDLYGRLSHAVSQRTFLELSDRFRYQEKDGQSDLGDAENQNFFENDLMGSLGFTLSPKNQIKLGGGYEFRTWDDDEYGKEWNEVTGRGGNNYDQLKADGSFVRELKEDTTHAMVGVNYVNHEYNGARGGFDSTTLYGGVDHTFNPKMSGTAQLGWSLSSVDRGANSEDTSSPFLETGLEYQPTERTSINGSLGYSLSQSQNSYYNAQEGFDVGLGVRHDLTGKITLSGTLSYIFSMYDSAYGNVGLEDAEENYVRLSLRGSYQINRNNFVDVGYEISQRDSDSPGILSEYTRNRVDIGWRLRL